MLVIFRITSIVPRKDEFFNICHYPSNTFRQALTKYMYMYTCMNRLTLAVKCNKVTGVIILCLKKVWQILGTYKCNIITIFGLHTVQYEFLVTHSSDACQKLPSLWNNSTYRKYHFVTTSVTMTKYNNLCSLRWKEQLSKTIKIFRLEYNFSTQTFQMNPHTFSTPYTYKLNTPFLLYLLIHVAWWKK